MLFCKINGKKYYIMCVGKGMNHKSPIKLRLLRKKCFLCVYFLIVIYIIP